MASSRSRHRLLEKSIHSATFHNRMTEEEMMWQRRELERSKRKSRSRDRDRSEHRHRYHSSPDREKRNQNERKNTEGEEREFGPPLPSSLGIQADRWDHALYFQRYPEIKTKERSPDQTLTSSNGKKKKKHHQREKNRDRERKQRHRSRS